MKLTKLKTSALAAVVAVGLFAFTAFTGSIKGTVTPASAITGAMAISGMDTLKAFVDNGSFSFNDVKAGTYKVVIVAAPPYKNYVKDGIMVTDGKLTDLGSISLQQ